MKNAEFEELVREFRAQQDELILTKGNDYTVGYGENDRLWNFKTVGGLLGITPLQCLGVFWLKHVLAICTFIKNGKVESEDIDGRFVDESNYNLLGRALVKEMAELPQLRVATAKAVRKKMPSLRRDIRSRNKRVRDRRKR